MSENNLNYCLECLMGLVLFFYNQNFFSKMFSVYVVIDRIK